MAACCRTTLLIALLLLMSRAPSSETSVRLDVRYEASWELTHMEVSTRSMTEGVAPTAEVLVLVPVGWAGEELPIEVVAFRGETRYAAGEVTVAPVGGDEVRAVVELERLPCGDWCTAGATRCEGAAVVRCEEDTDGCTQWGPPVVCPEDAPHCSLGTCSSTCVDECAEGETTCDGMGVRRCGEADGDDCLDWLPRMPCEDGNSCSGGRCLEGCEDACEDGAVQCAEGGVSRCADADRDGCTEWGPSEPCDEGESCSSGRCEPIDDCTDECSEAMCDGTTWRECGQYDLDDCLELSPGTSCVSDGPCEVGRCGTGGCTTAPLLCESPPESTCIDDGTLRVFEATGTCGGDGECSYGFRDRDCPNCPSCDPGEGVVCDSPPNTACYEPRGECVDGSCHYEIRTGSRDDGDPCTLDDRCQDGRCAGAERSCDAPPADVCVDASTLRRYGEGGTCEADGGCSYPAGRARVRHHGHRGRRVRGRTRDLRSRRTRGRLRRPALRASASRGWMDGPNIGRATGGGPRHRRRPTRNAARHLQR